MLETGSWMGMFVLQMYFRTGMWKVGVVVLIVGCDSKHGFLHQRSVQ